MENKRKVKLKSCKKQLRRDQGPLLKPDVMLITKDVMVPIKVPSPPGRRFPSAQNSPKTKFTSKKAQRPVSQPLNIPSCSEEDFAQSYTKDSLPQMKEIIPEKKCAEKTLPKSPFCCTLGVNKAQKNVNFEKTETVLLKTEHISLRPSSGLFELNAKDSRDTESVKLSEVDKPLAQLSRNSISSFTTSVETRSCSSTKSLDVIEDSLPKLPSSIISSSESESNYCTPVIPAEYHSKTSVQSNNRVKNFDAELENKSNSPNSSNDKSGTTNTTDKVIIECKNDYGNDVDDKVFEDNQIMIDVEYVLQNLLANFESVKDFSSFDQNSIGNINVDKESSQTCNKSDYNLKCFAHNLEEAVLASDNFDSSSKEQPRIKQSRRRYSWQELNLEEEESEMAYSNLDINSNPSNEQIQVKYSWQIIKLENQELSGANRNKSINNYENSKLTSTQDLRLYTPEIRYSWQELTSKYLPEKPAEDNLSGKNQPVLNIDVVPKKTSNAECLTDFSSFRENFVRSSSLSTDIKKEEKNKAADDVGKVAANSPLNNIISSMLPEMKLFNRRISFNDTTAEIAGNLRDNCKSNSNKSSASYSSVSSIKHVIENLNEMVTTQKHMLDAYVKDHKLDQSFSITESSANTVVNTVEKVEIFPSTLHVLGNYIVRDIRPTDMNDQRDLLDSSNDKTIQDQFLSDGTVELQNTRLNKPVENVLNEQMPSGIVKPAVLDPDLSTRSNDSWFQLPNNSKEPDLSSLIGHPVSYDLDYYSRIFSADYKPSPKTKNQNKDKPKRSAYEKTRDSLLFPFPGYNRRLSEKNWEQAIAKMEETIGLSEDAKRLIDECKDDGNEDTPYTQSTGPLTPRVQVSLSEIKEAVTDSKNRKEELIARLEAAMSRLKQSEQHLDANWNLDYSVLDIEESISDKEVQLPKQVEEHVKDIVKSAEEYLAKLEEQLNDLRNADDQIINSSERTFKDIDETYQLFIDNLCREINKRRDLVRLETEVFKYEGLAPLRACKQEVDAQIRSTQHLIVLTENMLLHPVTFNKERLGKIINATSHMGRIPAVPMPEELPYVTFSPPSEEIQKEIVDRISCLGCVMRMGPAQFTEVCERPACLQLKWHVVDPEYASEEQTFIVEKAIGKITEPTSSAFETVYVGPENSCFVRDLPVDQQITLRVGIQVTDTAWSVHRIAQTSIPAYSWDMNNSDYLITNSGRIATKVTQNLSTLLSRSPQFSANYIIEFKFLEAASGTDDEGIGLVFEPGGANETLKRIGALLITPNGNIFMNGEQKLMQLPKIVLGTRIIFTSEPKDDETLRMTIECANKAVTYDWTVQRPLHFAARFSEHNKWNLMVK